MAEDNKIKIERVRSVLGALNIIPRASLRQTTRVKVLRWLIAYDKLLDAFNKEVELARAKVKSDGFDERMAPYMAALMPTKENEAEAEKQAAAEDFAEAKTEWDRANADFRELYEALNKETKWEVPSGLAAFTDEDFEEIGVAIPSGGPSIMQQLQSPEQEAPTADEDAETATESVAIPSAHKVAPILTNDDVLMILMNTLK